MEIAVLQRQLKEKFGDAILDLRPLGTGGDPCVWVEANAIESVLKELSGKTGEWPAWRLEDVSVFEMDRVYVVTCFLATATERLNVRLTLGATGAEDYVELPDISSIFPNARTFESKLRELWGIRFVGDSGKTIPGASLLPEGWSGFPMRKNYLFPTEFNGIPHQRPIGRTHPDEYGMGVEE